MRVIPTMADHLLYDLLQGNQWAPGPSEMFGWFGGGQHTRWFSYDYVVQDYERMGYDMPFPLSRAEFGKELANFVYHNRGLFWLNTKRVSNGFGSRIRWYRIVPLEWG